MWIAVIFFCVNSECAFWKAEELFNSKAKCENSLSKAMDIFERSNMDAAGACLNIKATRA